jgi:very-short-patch-repair endonuclease
MTSIYLAGKIGSFDWREDLVPGIQDAWGGSQERGADDTEWPVIPNGVIGEYDYTGPYFVGTCTHSDTGCSQGEHRAGSECEGDYGERSVTLQRCLRAIDRADIVFAWLSDLTAHGTLTEIGYAKGRGKTVIVASPEKPGTVDDFYEDAVEGRDRHTLGMHHLWFAFTLADVVITTATPLEALKQFADLTPRLESPIEEAFWRAYLSARPPALKGLVAQYEVPGGRYRLDFALPEAKIGIELDGYAYHSSREAFTHDRKRERDLELAGWRIIRFSGSEINKSAGGCVREAAQLAVRHIGVDT